MVKSLFHNSGKLKVISKGMALWLKFNSAKLSIDSSLNHNLLTQGKPEKLKENANVKLLRRWRANKLYLGNFWKMGSKVRSGRCT